MFCITCIIHQCSAAATHMHCGHANSLLICLLQTHQGENEKVVSHRGTAPPRTTCCHVEEPPQVKEDCGMHLLLLVTLYWICVYTGWSWSKQNKWSPAEVLSAWWVMLRCCQLRSLLQVPEEQSQQGPAHLLLCFQQYQTGDSPQGIGESACYASPVIQITIASWWE